MQRELASAIGLPRRPTNALWILVFLMPAEVSRNFIMHLLDACPERLLPERRLPEFDLVSLSFDLLGQLENDRLRTTDLAELVPPKVLYLAEGFRPFRFQPGNDSFDILDDECDVPDTQGVGRKLPNTSFKKFASRA